MTLEMDLRLEAAALSEMAELTAADTGLPRARSRVGADRPRRADARMDRRDQALRRRRASRRRTRPAGTGAKADPVVPSACASRRLLPCRHAPGQPLRRRGRRHRRGRFRHHGPARQERSGGSSPKSCSASSGATTAASPRCISRPATCPANGTRSTISHRRSGRSASRSTARSRARSRWPGCSRCSSR